LNNSQIITEIATNQAMGLAALALMSAAGAFALRRRETTRN